MCGLDTSIHGSCDRAVPFPHFQLLPPTSSAHQTQTACSFNVWQVSEKVVEEAKSLPQALKRLHIFHGLAA